MDLIIDELSHVFALSHKNHSNGFPANHSDVICPVEIPICCHSISLQRNASGLPTQCSEWDRERLRSDHGLRRSALAHPLLLWTGSLPSVLVKNACMMPYNWAAGVHKKFTSLGMASPFPAGRIHNIDCLSSCKAMLSRKMSVWDGLHMSLRGASSQGAKLCT